MDDGIPSQVFLPSLVDQCDTEGHVQNEVGAPSHLKQFVSHILVRNAVFSKKNYLNVKLNTIFGQMNFFGVILIALDSQFSRHRSRLGITGVGSRPIIRTYMIWI